MYRIGVDIGGMSVKTGIVDEYGRIIKKTVTKTDRNTDAVLLNIKKDIDKLLAETGVSATEIKGIGVGCPGTIDSRKGEAIFVNNLGWEHFKVVKGLKAITGMKVKVSNDANVAALAETLYGAAKDYKNAVMLTLGTGIGGGIVINKKIYSGGHSQGAEPGHVTLISGGEPCSCGRRGCAEMYASATALIKQTKKAMLKNKDSKMWDYVNGDIEKVDGKTAFETSKQGDPAAVKVVDQYVAYLTDTILNMLNIFRPDAVIIGGGVSAQGDYLMDRIRARCEAEYYGYKMAPKSVLLTAKLGNDAGIIGAAALFE